MIWILAFKLGSGRPRNTMKGFWISLTGQVEMSISSLGRTKVGNSMVTPGLFHHAFGLLLLFFWKILIINRMAGPVRRGGQSVHWATSPPRSNQSPTTSSRLSSQSSVPIYFSPGDHRLVDSSPLSVDNLFVKTPTDSHLGQQDALYNQSAPGMLGRQYDLLSMKTPEMKLSLDQQQRRFNAKNLPPTKKDDFELDPMAPIRAMRSTGGKSGGSTSLHSLEKVEERAEEPDDDVREFITSHQQQEERGEDSWGDCFAVEWISTRKLPFNRTRQIRNPWNHDREVKVSRDGTELEPTVGQKLLDEWHKLSEPQDQEPLTFEGGVGQGDHGGGSKLDGSEQQSAEEDKEGEKAD